MLKLKIIIFLFFPISIISQNIKGKVYDNTSTVKGATIYNLTKNQINYTDENGSFEVQVSINDSLLFYSLFHHKKSIIINKSHYKNILVIELKKAINELDEVLLSNELEPKPFDSKKETYKLNEQIKNDIKQNPSLYGLQPNNGLDFIKIASLIGKLFKKKKAKDKPIIPLIYKQFDSLFTHDKFFNNKLLSTELKIPNNYKTLFFDYCDAQEIDKKLMLNKNQFLLLDELLKCSNAFLEILSDYKKE
jgi:hypothetical protein